MDFRAKRAFLARLWQKKESTAPEDVVLSYEGDLAGAAPTDGYYTLYR